MNLTNHRAARSALSLGLIAGAMVILSAWTPGRLVQAPPAEAPPTPSVTAPADAAPADAAAGERPVTFSADQADRGEEDFVDDCADCHGETLRGGLLGGPPLRGVTFEEKYANGAPAGVLFEVMVATMPPNAPGRYSPETYADLMAYILERNGFRAGAALPADVDALYSLIMEK